MEEENYGELMDKEITFIQFDGTSVKCKVTGIDEDVGLSIQRIDNGDYMLCLNGPSSPLFPREEITFDLYYEEYKVLFESAIEQIIKEGMVRLSVLLTILRENGGNVGVTFTPSIPSDSCAFNQ